MTKENRIKYVGFNDFWFSVIGIILLSIITTYLFNRAILQKSIISILLNWSVSLMFSATNWLILRKIMIHLRKRYYTFSDSIKRIVLFFLLIVVVVLLVDTFGNLLLSAIFKSNFNPLGRAKVILPIVIISVMTFAIYEAIYFYIRLKKSVQEEEEAKKAKVQAQLDALSNQVQPHFFFNSLNTLRDIIDQNTKEDATLFVNKLSNIYRYILEAENFNLIVLEKEIKFAESYIHIQKERFGDNFSINWSIDALAKNKYVVPMSLQLLIENAIKHNIVSKSKPLSIKITTKDDQLIVSNPIQSKSSKTFSTQLGLNNIERRYELISQKKPDINNNGITFSVALPLLQSNNPKQTNENTNH